ncbi:hypothetical protein DFH06DRAFT_461924 [Mycena polygramma]|nr:hypothetical protein DFH06DRAFT_461924 [Mycena polygramma]
MPWLVPATAVWFSFRQTPNRQGLVNANSTIHPCQARPPNPLQNAVVADHLLAFALFSASHFTVLYHALHYVLHGHLFYRACRRCTGEVPLLKTDRQLYSSTFRATCSCNPPSTSSSSAPLSGTLCTETLLHVLILRTVFCSTNTCHPAHIACTNRSHAAGEGASCWSAPRSSSSSPSRVYHCNSPSFSERSERPSRVNIRIMSPHSLFLNGPLRVIVDINPKLLDARTVSLPPRPTPATASATSKCSHHAAQSLPLRLHAVPHALPPDPMCTLSHCHEHRNHPHRLVFALGLDLALVGAYERRKTRAEC